MRNKIIPYNPKLKEYARLLRKNSTLSEVLLWKNIKNRALGVPFHRQVPMLEFIVDFYCHEIQLAIEIDGISHDYRYEAGAKPQGLLEEQGVEFIRFSDIDVKKNMFNVALALAEKIEEILEKRVFKDTPLSPRSRGESLNEPLANYGSGPLKSGGLKEFADTSLKNTILSAVPSSSVAVRGGSSYPKKQKLKSKKLIDKLFAEGKSVSQYPIKLIYLNTELPEDVKIQAGVAVPKKNFKSAVKRNRIKRLLREAYRLNKHGVFNNSKVPFAFLFLYLGKEMPSFIDIERNMEQVLVKFLKKEKTP